jgi:hypothetical protein
MRISRIVMLSTDPNYEIDWTVVGGWALGAVFTISVWGVVLYWAGVI